MSNVVPSHHRTEDDALWSYVDSMAKELRELKAKLHQSQSNIQKISYQSDAYFEFVANLREKMRAHVEKNYYPKIRIDGMELGIDFKGLLYDRETNITLPRTLAFEVYHKLYDQHLIEPFFK